MRYFLGAVLFLAGITSVVLGNDSTTPHTSYEYHLMATEEQYVSIAKKPPTLENLIASLKIKMAPDKPVTGHDTEVELSKTGGDHEMQEIMSAMYVLSLREPKPANLTEMIVECAKRNSTEPVMVFACARALRPKKESHELYLMVVHNKEVSTYSQLEAALALAEMEDARGYVVLRPGLTSDRKAIKELAQKLKEALKPFDGKTIDGMVLDLSSYP